MAASGEDFGRTIAEDIAHQRKVWVIERISWALMTLLIIAALLGYLGNGPLSRQITATPDTGLQVEYQRFERHRSAARIRIRLDPAAARNGATRLSIGGTFFDAMQITRMEPAPERVETSPGQLIYVFNQPDAATPAELLIHIEPTGYGSVLTRMQLEGHQPEIYTQFIYP